MPQQTPRPTRTSTLRAAVLTLLALAAIGLIWQSRPSISIPTTSPDAGIVAGCAWLAWALAGYLAIAVAATAAATVATAGSVTAASMRHIAPRQLRRLVDAAITVGVAGAVIGSTAAAPAAAVSVSHLTARAPTVAGSPFDWPGLSGSRPSGSGSATSPHHATRHQAHHGKTSDGNVVVVQPGDTLWTIAAQHLGPQPSGAAITAAWHSWYAANRSTIGSNPSLIQPGQRLVVPDATAAPH